MDRMLNALPLVINYCLFIKRASESLLLNFMKKILFYLFLVLFFSCSKEELRQEFVVQEIDELRIQDSLNFFLTIPRLAEINQEGVLVSFDKAQEEFQLFDLNSSKLIKRVPVQYFGPNSISENIFSSMLFNGNILISTAESIAVLEYPPEQLHLYLS